MTGHIKTASPKSEVWVPDRKLSDREIRDYVDVCRAKLEIPLGELSKHDRRLLAEALTKVAAEEGQFADMHGANAVRLHALAREYRP